MMPQPAPADESVNAVDAVLEEIIQALEIEETQIKIQQEAKRVHAEQVEAEVLIVTNFLVDEVEKIVKAEVATAAEVGAKAALPQQASASPNAFGSAVNFYQGSPHKEQEPLLPSREVEQPAAFTVVSTLLSI